MKDKHKLVSVFPYNGDQYLKNIAFDIKKNKGIEALIFATLKNELNKKNIEIATYDVPARQSPFKYAYFAKIILIYR